MSVLQNNKTSANFFYRGLALSDNSPVRDPDWRYQLVTYITEIPGRDTLLQWADETIREAVTFCREKERLWQLPEIANIHDDDKDLYCGLYLSRAYPDLATAWSIHSAAKSDLEVDLQCAILSRMSTQEICNEFTISERTLDYYKRLFYDVDGRLDSQYYVVHYCIFFRADSYNFLDYQNLSRFLSYYGGPEMYRFIRHRRMPGLEIGAGRLTDESLQAIQRSTREMVAIRRWAYVNTPEEKKILSRIISGINDSIERIKDSQDDSPGIVKTLLQELQMQLPGAEESNIVENLILEEQQSVQEILRNQDRTK